MKMGRVDYLVEKYPNGEILRLIRIRRNLGGDPSKGVEQLENGDWVNFESWSYAFYILTGEIGEDITEEEAREIAQLVWLNLSIVSFP